MLQQKPAKLVLNQETLRNLTSNNPQRGVNAFITGLPQTCPECPSPPQTMDC